MIDSTTYLALANSLASARAILETAGTDISTALETLSDLTGIETAEVQVELMPAFYALSTSTDWLNPASLLSAVKALQRHIINSVDEYGTRYTLQDWYYEQNITQPDIPEAFMELSELAGYPITFQGE